MERWEFLDPLRCFRSMAVFWSTGLRDGSRPLTHLIEGPEVGGFGLLDVDCKKIVDLEAGTGTFV